MSDFKEVSQVKSEDDEAIGTRKSVNIHLKEFKLVEDLDRSLYLCTFSFRRTI